MFMSIDTVAVAVVVAAVVLTLTALLLFRVFENPQRKAARKLLCQVEQTGLHIVAVQLDHEGVRSRYDDANQLAIQAQEPREQAKAAFKERRYADAQRLATTALNLLKRAVDVQSSATVHPIA